MATKVQNTMKLWSLTPTDGARSTNWRFSKYDGADGPVIVRAVSEDMARSIASLELDKPRPELKDTPLSPWAQPADTEAKEATEISLSAAGEEGVLLPERFRTVSV